MRAGSLLAGLVAAAAIAVPVAEAAGRADFPLVATGGGLTLHKEMYALPVTYADAYHSEQTEAVFQLSAKHRVFGTRFYFAYTQISFWQAYDIEGSAPFRETNYNPEVFYRLRERTLGPRSVGLDAGFEHESNGQPMPRSRSWNLLYAAPYLRGDRWLLYAKIHYRIPEEDKKTPDQVTGDDNPDITDYLGYSDLRLQLLLPHDQFVHLRVRGWIGTGKGNASLVWSTHVPGDRETYLMVKASSGYGESLIDYDRSISRVGLGLLFNR